MGLTGLDGETVIHLPEEGVRLFKPLLDYSAHDLNVRFEPYEYGNNIIYEDRSMTVNTVPLVHRLPCVGFVFREKPKPRHINPDAIQRWQVPTCYRNNIKAGDDYVTPDGIVVPNNALTTDPDPARVYRAFLLALYQRDDVARRGKSRFSRHDSRQRRTDNKHLSTLMNKNLPEKFDFLLHSKRIYVSLQTK